MSHEGWGAPTGTCMGGTWGTCPCPPLTHTQSHTVTHARTHVHMRAHTMMSWPHPLRRYAGSYEHVFETTIAGVTLQAPQLDINTGEAGV